MAKKQKYYVVWRGHKTGVFPTWAECKAAISDFQGAQYKSFLSLEQATKALAGNYFDYVGKKEPAGLAADKMKKIGLPNYNSISVDAASSGNPGIVEYQGVDTKTKKLLFHNGPFDYGTNNIGEFLALVHGLGILKRHNSKRILYTDSKTAMSWVKRKKCNTKLERTERNKELFDLVDRAEKWLQENDYQTVVVKWETEAWGEIPADFGRK